MQRRLAAILLLDMVGYSRLMGLDEEGTIAHQKAHRDEVIDPKLAAHAGRLVKTTGDGLLVEFPSVVDAVKCAIEVQKEFAVRKANVPEERRTEYRIGINLGDIVIDGDDILGDGVNIAARLEALAKPGGVCISGTVHDHLAGKLDAVFEDGGEQTVKNVPRPVRVWHWQSGQTARIPDDVDAPLQLPDRPSIAVLPFVNLSEDAEQEFFADGMTEDIIMALSRFRSLFVIARSSSFAYKGASADTRLVARDLGVRYVLEGSIRRGGERIRIAAQLIEAESGKHLWAERYDRKLDDLFAIQDEVTSSIVATIAPEIDEAERLLAQRKTPENLDLWGRFQIALSDTHKTEKEALESSVRQFEAINASDPTFALAFAHSARALHRLMTHFVEYDQAIVGEARRKADQAVELDPRDPDCILALSRILSDCGQHELAITKAEEALSLNPNSANAYYMLAVSLSRAGRPEEALPSIDLALRLSPRDIGIGGFHGVKAVMLFHLGRYEESIEAGKRSISSPNPRPIAYAYLIGALVRAGKHQEAAGVVSEFERLWPDITYGALTARIARRYAKAGEALENLFSALRETEMSK